MKRESKETEPNSPVPDSTCPFCLLANERVWMQSRSALAFQDAYPVTPGHTLVVPRNHAPSVFDLPPADQQDLWNLVAAARGVLKKELGVTAFNIGINDGMAAGQTVPHAHIHIIPRGDGDVDDPRGGIRWVIPQKAKYW